MIVHADWSKDARKRWMARAVMNEYGIYRAFSPKIVGNTILFVEQLIAEVKRGGSVLIGFDFPIGVPVAYASLPEVDIDDFRQALPRFGLGTWADFYTVADTAFQIALRRPFYPDTPGKKCEKTQNHLLNALGVNSINDLRRQCELWSVNRRAACPLFWTTGGQQVGKAAITGWRDVLGPMLKLAPSAVSFWPFDGILSDLFLPGKVVVAETYPAEFYHHLKLGFPTSRAGQRSGKRVQADRKANAEAFTIWSKRADVQLDAPLQIVISEGFGPSESGEDPFDAVVGLFGMLNVVLGHRTPGEPTDERVRKIEGWIFGQNLT